MGLLSRLTGKVTPQKKPTDDALLLHGMLLMCGADGSFDEQELPTVEGYFAQLPEFEGKEFGDVYQEAVKILKRFPSLKDSVKALGDLSSQLVKNKAYLLAADIAMSSGDVDEAEDAMLEAMQRVLNVEDALATKILEVLTLKYARA
ncbi:tellurite resistance TerB family protein [Nannocystis pusilla]|uniref:Tellurite resistance TerB family protein n=1 Tax=Nannocystis pusilla TaxID=889268 RepID=A0ABS7TZW2_9BACT|nr:tellurite resistance TerB family protein [Nannocystis pusilla]MBZ5713813.1 tellurite resistance TerB family protein [Nannocystis pusilla]